MLTAQNTELHRITVDIWSTVFDIDVESAETTDRVAGRSLTGTVQITGDWNGAVMVECSDRLARHATATMFGMEIDEVTEEDVHDTVGEIANMTGGNLKSLLPGSCQLSLPTVTSGVDYEHSVRGSRVVERVAFDAAGESLVVTRIERSNG